MPTMPRPKKAAKVAYMILGKPDNLAFKPTEAQKRIKEQLAFNYVQTAYPK